MQMRKLITLRDFQVGACIVSNMDLLGSYGNWGHQDHRSIRYVQCRGIHICSNPCSGHQGCRSCPGMGSRGWSRGRRMGGLGGSPSRLRKEKVGISFNQSIKTADQTSASPYSFAVFFSLFSSFLLQLTLHFR